MKIADSDEYKISLLRTCRDVECVKAIWMTRDGCESAGRDKKQRVDDDGDGRDECLEFV